MRLQNGADVRANERSTKLRFERMYGRELGVRIPEEVEPGGDNAGQGSLMGRAYQQTQWRLGIEAQ